jgi:hypothetical protein
VQLNFEKGTEDSECIFHDSFRGKSWAQSPCWIR